MVCFEQKTVCVPPEQTIIKHSQQEFVRSEAVMVAVTHAVLWSVTLCSVVRIYGYF